jgi:RNA polymerase sigma factor (sigma-70 family)
MDGGRLREFVTRLRRSVGPGDAGLSDADLLRRWSADRDPAAFEVLLWRHGPMVLGVCRRVLGPSADVEDAFQATFLALVQAAGSVHIRKAVGSWLHTVAYRVALRARTLAISRPPSSRPEPPALDDPAGALARQELREVVDEEVSRLPERYRAAVVLCYLEGRTNEEAARELGRPVGTVASRLARARELLRGRLVRRGLAPSALGGLGALAGEASAAPAGLIGTTLQAATGGAAVTASTVPAAALARGVLQAMFIAKLKWAAATVLAVAVLGTGGVFGIRAIAGGASGHQATTSEGKAEDVRPEKDGLQKGNPRIDAKPDSGKDPWAEKKYAFTMDGKPWGQVFEWLTDVTGKPVISIYKPSGTLSLRTKAGSKYSINEIIDLINEGLQANENTKKYILISRERSFTLVPAGEKIDGSTERTRLEDLDKRSNNEIVSVVMDLKTLVAEDLAPSVKKMMGPFGDVVAVPEANQLIMLDTVKNLKRVRDTIRKLEDSEKDKPVSYKHECKYIKARDAERIVKEVIGDAKTGKYYVSSDERTNTVLVTGPRIKVTQARTILREIDVPTKVTKDQPELKTFKVPVGNAENLAKALQDLFRDSANLRISALGKDRLAIYAADAKALEEVRKIIEVLTRAGATDAGRPDKTKPGPGAEAGQPSAAERLENARDLVDQLKADLQVKQAQLLAAKTRAQSVQGVLKRLTALAAKGSFVSEGDLEKARGDAASADAEVRIKEAELSKAELMLSQAQRKLNALRKDGPPPTGRLEERIKELQGRIDALQKELDGLRKELSSK